MEKKDIERLDEVLECGIFFEKGYPQVKDLSKFKKRIDSILDLKIEGNKNQLVAAYYLIYSIAWKLNIFPSSLQKVNKAQANHEFSSQFKIPILDMTDDPLSSLRLLFKTIKLEKTQLVSLSINSKHLDQNGVYRNIMRIFAAAILEEYSGPIFLQVENMLFDAKGFENDRNNLLERLKKMTQTAIKLGIYNINYDASELIDPEKSVVSEKMLMNLKMIAMSTNLWVRNFQPNGITVSVSGKIGKGAEDFIKNDELKDYLKRLMKEGSRLRFNTPGDDISKIEIDYNSLNKISVEAINSLNLTTQKEFGLGGIVLDLGEINNLSKFTSLKNLEVCEIKMKLVDAIKNQKSYQEIFRACNIENKNDILDKYIMKIDQLPKMNEY